MLAFLISSNYDRARDKLTEAAISRARAMASSIDKEFASTEAALHALMTSPLLAADDIGGFHGQVLKALPNIGAEQILLFDGAQKMLFSTRLRFGESLPAAPTPPVLKRLFDSGVPGVSDLFFGRVVLRPVFVVTVPVRRDGAIVYFLNASFAPGRLAHVLTTQKLPDTWRAAITDSSGSVAARTHESERFLGKKVSPDLLDRMGVASEGAFRTKTLDGIPVLTAYSRSPLSRWTVVLGMPLEEVTAGLWQTLAGLIVATFAALAIGLWLAWFIGGRIAGSIIGLIGPAKALGSGAAVAIPPSYFKEANEVGLALHDAAEALRRVELRVRTRTAELHIARDEAEKANHAKTAFLAAMSHEIRTPMNGVVGMIEVLQQTSLQGYQVEMIDLIRDSAFSLLQIIEDILDFSKIEAGRLELVKEPMAIGTIVEKVCGMLDHLAVKGNVRMTMFVDPAIPHTLMGDENRLRQVLINLAGNAIKFSHRDDRPGNVSVRVTMAEREGEAVTIELSVADDGIGIDEATLARLFTPFSQADASMTKRFGGTGLGLAISTMLAELMHGTISVRSVVDGGSTFTVRIPFVAAAEAAGDVDTLALVEGLRCRIVGSESPLADDLDAYLVRAGVIVERMPDLDSAAAAASVPGLTLWLILPDQPIPEIGELRAMAPCADGAETRFVVLEWGKRRRPRVIAPEVVMVDADTLSKRTLFRMLALASGRLKEESSSDVGGERTAVPSRQEAVQQHRLILVAEDNEMNRVVILRQLEVLGFAAEVAVDGIEALERWRSGLFALLLTDLHMPRMDGYALTRAIRSEEAPGCHMPIVAFTANALRDEELRCLAAGMDAYLSKPVRLAQLKASMDTWLVPAVKSPAPASSARSSFAATPPADLAVLVELVGDDPAVVEEVLQTFRDSAAQSSAELEEGIMADSRQIVVDAAHRLKSAARSIGALRVGELCAEIERAAGAPTPRELKALLPLFQAELAAVLRFLDSRQHAVLLPDTPVSINRERIA